MIGHYLNKDGKEYKVLDCVIIHGSTHYVLMETTRQITRQEKNRLEFKTLADDQKLLLSHALDITKFRRGRL